MRIAGVSMAFNDGYKLKEWIEHYNDYKDQLIEFIVVDNGSTKGFQKELEAAFPDAVILHRKANGGCTAAYNDGIRYALENTDADAIVILGNDVKVTKNCLPAMYEYLFSKKEMGVVSSAVLNISSDIIDNYGHTIKGYRVINNCKGVNIHSITEKNKETDLVTGGFYMAKREFFEKGGLQDEKLFMYGDELDTAFKARKMGYKIGVIANEYAWHWHINPPGKSVGRPAASRYMISRNRMYLVKKYLPFPYILKCFVEQTLVTPFIYFRHYITDKDPIMLDYARYSLIGGWKGLIGDMEPNKYSYPIKTNN